MLRNHADLVAEKVLLRQQLTILARLVARDFFGAAGRAEMEAALARGRWRSKPSVLERLTQSPANHP